MTDIVIGVMGCGWLGLPLASEFVSLGHHVKGTTTSKEKLDVLLESGIRPYQIHISQDNIKGDISGFLEKLDILVLNIPPRLRQENKESYVRKMEHLIHTIAQSSLKSIIFISSTSVYGEQEGDITEDTPPKPKTESARQLVEVENLFRKINLDTTIIRFGGLIGEDRHPVYHLAKKPSIKNGDELVNLIHLNDCIRMITTVVEKGYWNEIFNGVYPLHPKKREYYQKEAKKRNIPSLRFSPPNVKVVQKYVKSKNFITKGHSFLTTICS